MNSEFKIKIDYIFILLLSIILVGGFLKPLIIVEKINYEGTGIYQMEDDYGMSYYFRGVPDNNYVKFGKNEENKDEHKEEQTKSVENEGPKLVRKLPQVSNNDSSSTSNDGKINLTLIAIISAMLMFVAIMGIYIIYRIG